MTSAPAATSRTASPRSTLLIANRADHAPEFRSRNCAHRGRETVLVDLEAGLVGYLHQIVSRRRAAQLRLNTARSLNMVEKV